jgi:hypothetical protein
MTSPYPLAITVEMFYDGVWNDITVDTRQTTDITMRWGRADEASVAAPSELAGVTLNNGVSRVNPAVSGRYSLRNPRSDLFGKISRNTPIRVRLGDPEPTGLILAGHDTANATTPDHSSLDITGDIEIRAELTPATWRPGPSPSHRRAIASKSGLEDNLSWYFFIASGNLVFGWSPDGLAGSAMARTSTALVPTTAGAVRVVLDVNNGAAGHTVTFYTSDTIDGTWTQLGSPIVTAGVTSIFSSNASVEVGTHVVFFDDDAFEGVVSKFRIYGSTGVIRANPDFTTLDACTGGATLTDSAGRVWSLGALAYVDDRSIRAAGEITDMPVEWDSSGRDVWVPVRAKSITRRLGQGASPLRSSLYRDLSTAPTTVAYWPLEDGSESTTAAPVIGNRELVVTGDVSMAGYSGFAGSDAVPTFGDIAHIGGAVPAYVSHNRQRVACMLHQSSTQPADRNLLFLTCTGGSVADATLVLKSDGSLRIVLRNSAGTSLLDFSGGVGDLRDENAMVWMLLEQVGANIDWQIGKIAEGEGFITLHSGTLAGNTYRRFTTIQIGAAGDLAGSAVGHVHIMNGDDTAGLWATAFTSLVAWEGETAGERIARLHAEQGVPLTPVGRLRSTTRMGRQGIKTFLDLINECAETDLGVLDDHTRLLAKRYRTRESLYNQDTTLTLDYSAGEPAPPLRPIPDDQTTRNDVTVTRDGGSSARSTQETGPLNIQDPMQDPQGVGRYDVSVPLSLNSDSQVQDQAGWRRHLGTVDEDRYPSIKVNLGRDPHLTDAVKALDPGGRMQITNPPDWLPAGAIDQLVQGGAETLHPYRHEVELVCTPASPWTVTSASDGTDEQRADSGGSTTSGSFDAGTGTSLSVVSTSGNLWTTAAANFPLEVALLENGVPGVVLEVTAISGATSPQTFTVTATPVNGVIKTVPSGSEVVLAPPSIIGL